MYGKLQESDRLVLADTLGFGTCQDVLVDKHPTERMV
jgi:hypothetical protein